MPKSPTKEILAALENLTISVGKLKEEVAEIKKETKYEETKGTLPEKVSLESLEITTGKLPEDEQLERVRKLEEGLGTRRTNLFGTTELTIFEERMATMTRADMQNLAHKVGVDQNLDQPRLRKALKNAFIQASKDFGGGLRFKPQAVQRRLDPHSPKDLKLMRMLGMATQ